MESLGNIALLRYEIESPFSVQAQITGRRRYIRFQSVLNAVVRNDRRMGEFLIAGNDGSVVLPLAALLKSVASVAAREKRRAHTNGEHTNDGDL